VLVITLVNFSRTDSPEENRRELILKELSGDFFFSGAPTPLNSEEYRDAAAPYINKRLREMNEPWQFDPNTNKKIPYR